MRDSYREQQVMAEHERRWLEPDPEPEQKYICERCLCEITEGERKWDIYGSILCDSCAQEQFSEIVED